MGVHDRITTTVSTKGQVILPKAIRDGKNWAAGTKLLVEETAEGVLLKAAPLFSVTEMDAVFGSLRSDRAALSVEEMDAVIAREAARRAGD
ncbi:MAG: AbrB/MazE/SpoVT family DNA-binding domain-containing protein [Sphingobium sp.]|uniref:AbrB/MazE/SpoVT family DNA-binding domain-containing protein n=1 Tax=Sphingobium sp. TaxID=1912891 RepID=UPI002E1CF619